MKTVIFAAALILSAVTLRVEGQSSSPTPVLSPELATSVSKGPDWKIPVGRTPALDLLNTQHQGAYTRPDSKTRFKRYVNGMIGPVTLARAVGRAGIATWQNSPEEWGGQ